MKNYSMGLYLLIILLFPAIVFCGETDALTVYPNSVYFFSVNDMDTEDPSDEMKNGDLTNLHTTWMPRLSGGSVEHILMYYQFQMSPQDTIKVIEDGYLTGYEITFNIPEKKGTPACTARVKIVWTDFGAKKKAIDNHLLPGWEDAELSFPLKALKSLTGKYGHTKSEYDALLEKYLYLNSMYYRNYPVTHEYEKHSGEDILSGYNKIIDKYKYLAYGLKYMDYEFQSVKTEPNKGPKPGYNTTLPEKDTWDLWIECLGELEKAAYPVLIQHEETTFWYVQEHFSK